MFPGGLDEIRDGVADREPDVQQQHLHEVEPGQGVQRLLEAREPGLSLGGECL